MRVVSLEDARRVFLATIKVIYLNDSEDSRTYGLSRNEDRINLPRNSGDVINIPSKDFKKALEKVIRQFGLHSEQKGAFIDTFVELHWIMRPKDRNRRYKNTKTSRCRIEGHEYAVYRIDGIIFDFLESMNGVKVKDISNGHVKVPQRSPDGDLVMVNGNTVPTTVTAGQVCDARYERVKKEIDARIKQKEGSDV